VYGNVEVNVYGHRIAISIRCLR